jgi:FtsH-binding integral membrane protein
MQQVLVQRQVGNFGHIMQVLGISLLISFAGTLFGSQFIPPEFVGILSIVELVMIIAAVIIRIRGKYIGYGFLYAFTGISGITLYPIIEAYGATIGANLVSAALLTTAAIFIALSFYAYRSERDFSFLLGFLFAGTIALVVMGIAGIFFEFGSTMNIIWAIGGILIFSGWILFDISQYRHGVPAQEVPYAVLNLYLDIVNLFLYILRFLAAITGNRD